MHLRPGVTTYAIAWMLQTHSMAPSLIYTISFSLCKIIHLVHLHSGTVWRTHNPLCRLKVKVTLQCHGIYPSILCLIHTFTHHYLLNPLNLFWINFTQMFSQCDSVQNPRLRNPDSRSRSCSNIPLNFVSAPHISWTIWMIYIKLHSNFSETVCRTHDSVMQTQGHCHILM